MTKWTPLTAICFERDMVCNGCPNTTACNIGDRYHNGKKNKTDYGLRKTKYLALRTFAEIGFNDLDIYINVEALKQRRGYDTRE